MGKPILCLDFDGVLHSYSSGWKGADVIPDPPTDGAMRFLWNAAEYFTIAIFSSRSHQSGGKSAMKSWLTNHMRDYWAADRTHCDDILDDIQWPMEKPAAFVTLDDRAITFEGEWPDPKSLLEFKPWNKRTDTPLDVSFKLTLLPSGDLGRLRLTKDGSEMIFTKEQAQILANEIARSFGGQQ